MTSVLVHACLLFITLFVLGYLASAALYKSKRKSFYRSALWTKVMLWVPIFAIFLLYLSYPKTAGAIIIAIIILYCLGELKNRLPTSKHRQLVIIYGTAVIVTVSLFALAPYRLHERFVPILVTICFASVLADVFAFFFGNFFGRHHLPAALNDHKSWEGVFGELFGACIGVGLTCLVFNFDVSFWLFLPIGLGAIIGDLANSYVKRRENIKDWSQHLPGHGGYLDRFASLGGSAALVVLFVRS